MVGRPSRAIVIERNRTTARRLGRVLGSAGYQVEFQEGESVRLPAGETSGAPTAGPILLVGEAFSKDAILHALGQGSGSCAGVLYGGSDELDGSEMMVGEGLLALLGWRSPGSGRMDLEGELLCMARHLQGLPLPPLQAHLLWGAQAFVTEVGNIAGRDAASARLAELCSTELGTSRRVADAAGEVVHELITNAMYDAPVDEQGKERYAHDRAAAIELDARDRIIFGYATDGLRLALEVVDRFGRLRRPDLVKSLRRGVTGQINRDGGGAGIGLSVVFRACQTLQFDVEPGKRTRVTAVLDIEPRQQEAGARPPHSLLFSADGRAVPQGEPPR